MYFIPTGFLKDNIDVVCFTHLKISYIRDTNHPLHKNLVDFCREVHYMWWGNQYLELQE